MEITKLGQEAVTIYLQALNEGKAKIPLCNLLVLGRQEVGKTSLIRQLLGKDFLKYLERTRGIDNFTVEIKSIDTTSWQEKAGVADQFSDALLGELVEKLPPGTVKDSEAVIHSEPLYSKQVSENNLLMKLQEIGDMIGAALAPEVSESEGLPASGSSRITAQVVEEREEPAKPESVSDQTTTTIPTSLSDSENIGQAPQLSESSLSAGVLNSKETSRINQVLKNEQHFEKKEPSLVLNTLDFAGKP